MPKFFLSPEEIQGNVLTLTGEQFNHAKVLRLKPGDAVTVCDGLGTDYACNVESCADGQLLLQVLSSSPSPSEPRIHATVYMAFPKADKLEHVIQKATELGASAIVAFPSARCVSRPDEKSLRKKLERWQKIAAAAAEQSGRGKIPEVSVLPSYAAALKQAAASDLGILFYENEAQRTFRAAIEEKPFRSVAMLTGPEGGLEQSEVDAALAAGLQVCK